MTAAPRRSPGGRSADRPSAGSRSLGGRSVLRRSATRRSAASALTTHVILIFFSAVGLLPLVGTLLVSLYPADQSAEGLALPHSIDVGNYARAWNAANMGTLMRSSLIIAAVVVPLAGAPCVLAGYALGTMRFRGRSPLFSLLLIGLVLPFEATVVLLYYDLRVVGLTNTYPGLFLPEAALFLSFGTFWMRAHFASSPRSVIEAARLDGANSWRTLWHVLIPGARPAIITMTVLFFIWSWNEFLLALVLAQDPSVQTAPVGFSVFIGQYTTDTRALAAGAITMTVPALIVYGLLQRHFIQGATSGGIKG